jgi:hypothetical protein
MGAGAEPNAENKLFVGGCPADCNEGELKEVRRPRARPCVKPTLCAPTPCARAWTEVQDRC